MDAHVALLSQQTRPWTLPLLLFLLKLPLHLIALNPLSPLAYSYLTPWTSLLNPTLSFDNFGLIILFLMPILNPFIRPLYPTILCPYQQHTTLNSSTRSDVYHI